MCPFVHDRFGRQHVQGSAQSPHGRDAKGHVQHAVVDRLDRCDVVRRLRIALRPATDRHRGINSQGHGCRLCGLPGAQERGCGAPARACAVALAPNGLTPFGQLPVGAQAGLNAHRHGGSQRRVAQLGLACPLHPHGSAGHLLRQPGGIPSHIVGTVVAVAACALHMRDLHLFGRQTKSQRQVAPQVVNALAVAPDFEWRIGRPLRQCAAQAHRGVLQKGAVKLGA